MRSKQILPIALLALFALGLGLAIAFVQTAKNQADKVYMAEEVVINDLREHIYDNYLWVDKEDREEKFAKRIKALDERQEQAEKEWQAAKATAYSRQGYVIVAGFVLFLIFVVVTLYMGRKAADGPPA